MAAPLTHIGSVMSVSLAPSSYSEARPSRPSLHRPTACLPARYEACGKTSSRLTARFPTSTNSRRGHARFIVRADQQSSPGSQAGGSRDTRIHYSSPDEGWIGGFDSSSDDVQRQKLASGLAAVLASAENSHYKVLGVSPVASATEIREAQRKLSKVFHPDSTILPKDQAAESFKRVREAYDTLIDDETRAAYDYKVAAEELFKQQQLPAWSANPQAGNKGQLDRNNVAAVDKLGPGESLPLSSQTMTALAFDIFAFFVAIVVVIFVVIFKEGGL